MAINPFETKPQIDHKGLIDEFVQKSKPLFFERRELEQDVNAFEKQVDDAR